MRERRSVPNTGAHARLTVLRVVALVVVLHACVEVYLSVKSGNPSKALEKMGDMALGALLGIIARTESPTDTPQPVTVENKPSEPVPTTEAPAEGA